VKARSLAESKGDFTPSGDDPELGFKTISLFSTAIADGGD